MSTLEDPQTVHELFARFRAAECSVEREKALADISNYVNSCKIHRHGLAFFLQARCSLQMAVLEYMASIDSAEGPNGQDRDRFVELCNQAVSFSCLGGQLSPVCGIFHHELVWAMGKPPLPKEELPNWFSAWTNRSVFPVSHSCFPQFDEPLERQVMGVKRKDRVQFCIGRLEELAASQKREEEAGLLPRNVPSVIARMSTTLFWTSLLPQAMEEKWSRLSRVAASRPEPACRDEVSS